jgi:hypothetical protein
MFDKGFFGNLFDFNRDGKLDSFERAADFAAFASLVSENDDTEEETSEITDKKATFGDFSDDDFLEDDLDYDELSYMDEDERNELLEDAGLDPDDFDF